MMDARAPQRTRTWTRTAAVSNLEGLVLVLCHRKSMGLLCGEYSRKRERRDPRDYIRRRYPSCFYVVNRVILSQLLSPDVEELVVTLF